MFGLRIIAVDDFKWWQDQAKLQTRQRIEAENALIDAQNTIDALRQRNRELIEDQLSLQKEIGETSRLYNVLQDDYDHLAQATKSIDSSAGVNTFAEPVNTIPAKTPRQRKSKNTLPPGITAMEVAPFTTDTANFPVTPQEMTQ